ncbi:hypothetical protein JAAARDRAFT_34801 [Jaapia argillacea MUCL 33604]|uniref:Protein kinase domain-containing protein n=1 Tax=Jaapia argillacea MUCL 33604 TaxID=933084 RepID=A0A067PVV7_9AGAM|nr:hypothetical protein JAAARDRAFT_34801 [Jaapia argillacea MUCL 33604]
MLPPGNTDVDLSELWFQIPIGPHRVSHQHMRSDFRAAADSFWDPAVAPPFVGNIYQEFQRFPDLGLNLLAAAASQLIERHESRGPHGALTPDSFLVDRLGHVSLVDAHGEFAEHAELHRKQDRVFISAAWRYQPTEQLCPDNPEGDPVYDLKGDVFAFATIIYELFGGQLPRGRRALYQRIEGTRPLHMTRPRLLSNDHLWYLLTKSWSQDPEQRPSVKEIEDALLSTLESNT